MSQACCKYVVPAPTAPDQPQTQVDPVTPVGASYPQTNATVDPGPYKELANPVTPLLP